MEKKWMMVALLLCFSTDFLHSQKANFQLAEKFTTENMGKIVGSTSVRPNWLKNSNTFWYSYKTSDGTNYYMIVPEERKKRKLFDNVEMATELTKLTNKPYNENDLQLKNIKFKKNQKEFNFEIDSLLFNYNVTTRTVVLVDTIDADSVKHVTQTRQ